MSASLKSLQTRRNAARVHEDEMALKLQTAQATQIQHMNAVQALIDEIKATPEDDPALESLHARLVVAKAERALALSNLHIAKANRIKARQAVVDIAKQIEALSERGVVISEHAMLRYCERVYGFKREDIKAAILTPSVAASIKTFGDGKFPSGTGFTVVVKNRVVVSLME